jgi:hypothetical protein
MPADIKMEDAPKKGQTADAFQLVHILDNEEQMGVMPVESIGGRNPGEYSGVQAGYRIAQLNKKLVAVENSFTNGLSLVGGKILSLVELVGETVHGCKPNDISGNYETKVELDTKTPEEKQARLQLGVSLRGELSWHTRAKDYYSIDKPWEEFAKIQAERLISTGAFDQLIMEMVNEYTGVQAIQQDVKEAVKGRLTGARPSEMQEIPQYKQTGGVPTNTNPLPTPETPRVLQ